MDYRHEWKHRINYSDMLALRARLGAVAGADEHAKGGRYEIRSLYFDNLDDKTLREKLDGVNRREKFRIRCYNMDPSLIHLEKKSKCSGLGSKETAVLSLEQARALSRGDFGCLDGCTEPVLRELRESMLTLGLRPRTIVDYTREPFVFAPGNVRVTLDYNIRTGLDCTDFLDPGCVTVPVPGSPIILEVKWDGFLPDIIRDAVQLPGRRTEAFSKYAACRAYR